MKIFFHIAELPAGQSLVGDETPFAFLLTVQQQGDHSYTPFAKWMAAQYEKNTQNQTSESDLDLSRHIQAAWSLLGALAGVSRFVENGLKTKDIFSTPLRLCMADLQWLLLEIPELEGRGVTVMVPRSWDSTRKKPRSVQGAVAFQAANGSNSSGTGLGIGRFSLKATLDGNNVFGHDEIENLLTASSEFVWLDGGWVHFSSAKMRSTLGIWQGLREQYGEEVRVADALKVLARQAARGLKKRASHDEDTDFCVYEYDLDSISMISESESGSEAGGGDCAGVPADKAKAGGLSSAVEVLFAKDRESFLKFLEQQSSHYKLHPYQVTGCLWLVSRYRLGLGAILADDMGLGKTLQTISAIHFLLLEKSRAGQSQRNQVLIVAPTSLLYNWQREFSKFAPSLSVKIAHRSYGFEFSSSLNSSKDTDVIITSYGTMVRQIDFFKKRKYLGLVADEAQTIKNSKTQSSLFISSIDADFKIALTGTPVENSVQDVLSLVDFVFGSPDHEEARYSESFVRKEGEKSSESLSAVSQDDTKQETYHHVRQLLKPLLLRRMKSDSNIGIYLPDRFEKKYFVNLSQVQLALYQSLVVRFKKELTLVSEAKDQNEVEKESRRRGLILSTLIRLRQVCSEPRLVIASLDPMLLGEHAALLVDTLTSDDKNDVLSTGKFAELRRILTEASISGEKVVVFSQFLGCLDTLFNLSSSLGLPTYRVDGSMPPFERTRSIDLFQSQLQTAVLVLSLKAGGVGLNLTSANHIVHFDRWWNPAVEDQASDRVYRIGQTRNVRVNHLIARGTIEEGIDRLLESKRDLARDILETSPRTTDQGHGVVNLSDDEILELMQP